MPRPAEEQNLFDVIRLSLACGVVYSHATLLGGFGDEGFGRWARGQTIAGSLAVLGFFGVSGFLVTRSYCVRQKAGEFLRARLLRILPGFYLALLVTAFVLAPLIAWTNPAGGEWQAAAAGQYLLSNALVRVGAWGVGGVTTGLPYDGSINGALWSLFPECLCYLLVLILGVLGLLQGKRTSLFLFTALLAGMHFGLTLAPAQGENLAPTLLRLTHWSPYFLAFFVGACAFAAREQIEPNWKAAVFWGLVTLTLLRFGGWALAGPVVLPLAIIHLAYSGRVHLPGDISYGIYVLHFPVLQWLAGTSLRSHGWGWFLAAGLGLTGLLATASWLAVERPCLRLKTRAVSAG